jgi:hypothetical protein
MKIKSGVDMSGLRIEMRAPLKIADRLWRERGQELVVTSALDGEHSAGSLHYFGYALDFRTRYFDEQTVKELADNLRNKLGSHYDVIIHSTHMHVEYEYIKSVGVKGNMNYCEEYL